MAERDLDKLVDQAGEYIYIGLAPPGTKKDTKAWKIVRLQTSPVEKRYAQGNPEFVHIWDDRATYTY
jgi:hypothetical protein